MASNTSFWRIVWPERGPLSVAIGGIVSLLCDFGGFLANIASPSLLLWPIAALAALFCWFCLRRVRSAPEREPAGDDGPAVGCLQCNLFRVMLFASLALGVLLLAGQGTTATERFGEQLGLIQRDVTQIREDTGKIREDTDALRDIHAGAELVRRPRTAEDFFRNAWIYSNVRRDNAQAWESVQALYRLHTPNKIDAADLYRTIGMGHLGHDALQARMLEVGRQRRDAAMLVVVARNMGRAEAQPVYDEARGFDAGMPFAHFDVFRNDHLPTAAAFDSSGIRALRDGMREAAEGYGRFSEVAAQGPVARYFYLPQYQIDFELHARNQRENAQRLQATYEQLLGQRESLEKRQRR